MLDITFRLIILNQQFGISQNTNVSGTNRTSTIKNSKYATDIKCPIYCLYKYAGCKRVVSKGLNKREINKKMKIYTDVTFAIKKKSSSDQLKSSSTIL